MPPPYTYLFDKINECLESKPHLNWVLTLSDKSNVAYILQLGRHGSNMRVVISHPNENKEPGCAEISFELGPEDFKVVQQYVKAHPKFNEQDPFKKDKGMIFVSAHEKELSEEDRWTKGGLVFWFAYVNNPASEELYQRMSVWYVDCLESIFEFLKIVAHWNQTRG